MIIMFHLLPMISPMSTPFSNLMPLTHYLLLYYYITFTRLIYLCTYGVIRYLMSILSEGLASNTGV